MSVKDTVSVTETKAYIDRVHARLTQQEGFVSRFNAWTPLYNLFDERKRALEFWVFMGAACKFAVPIEIAAMICFAALDGNRTLFNVAESFQVVSPEVRQLLVGLGDDVRKIQLRPRNSRALAALLLAGVAVVLFVLWRGVFG
jgi:hypothetical protein